MTQEELRELQQRVGREIAIELKKNEATTLITEEDYEKLLINEEGYGN